MGQNLFQFIEVARVDPHKKRVEERCREFAEIYQQLPAMQVSMQADRCLGCGNPYCEWRCPVHNYIPNWLALANAGRIVEAAELCHQTNSLPEVCGRVCPQDRLCEGACTLNTGYGAVTIGAIEKHIVDTALAMGWTPDLRNVPASSRRVAVVGAGPAGLACADVLIRNGVQPTVFERNPEIGGLLTFGIPAFKLDKKVMVRRRQVFTGMGIDFRLGVEVGRDITFAELLADYDAVFVGTGAYTAIRAGLEHEDVPGVHAALDYLIANTDHLLGGKRSQYPYINLQGRRVVVLGGGDTAMDCLRTAVRQGAAEAVCAYRRDRRNMPGSAREVANAEEEGVQFLWNVQPQAILTDSSGRACGVRLQRTCLGEPDERGRCRAELIPGSEMELAADTVITAFGFAASTPAWLTAAGVELTERNLIATGGKERLPMQTSLPQVFAGGDAVRGSSLVVHAIHEGRTAAESILHYFEN